MNDSVRPVVRTKSTLKDQIMKGYIALALCVGLVTAMPTGNDNNQNDWMQMLSMMAQQGGQMSGQNQWGCHDCSSMINQEMMKRAMSMLYTHNIVSNTGSGEEQHQQQQQQQWGMGNQQMSNDDMIRYCMNLLSQMSMNNHGSQSQGGQYGNMNAEMQNVLNWMNQQSAQHAMNGQHSNAINMQQLVQWAQEMHAREQKSRQLSQDDLKEMRKMKEFHDMSKLAEFVMHYMSYKEKSSKFEEAMYHICFVVNVTQEDAKRTGRAIFTRTTAESMAALEEQVSGMNEAQTAEFVVNLFFNDNGQFNEVFFRMADAACKAGMELHEVEKAFEALDDSDSDSQERMMMDRRR